MIFFNIYLKTSYGKVWSRLRKEICGNLSGLCAPNGQMIFHLCPSLVQQYDFQCTIHPIVSYLSNIFIPSFKNTGQRSNEFQNQNYFAKKKSLAELGSKKDKKERFLTKTTCIFRNLFLTDF